MGYYKFTGRRAIAIAQGNDAILVKPGQLIELTETAQVSELLAKRVLVRRGRPLSIEPTKAVETKPRTRVHPDPAPATEPEPTFEPASDLVMESEPVVEPDLAVESEAIAPVEVEADAEDGDEDEDAEPAPAKRKGRKKLNLGGK